MNLLLYVNTSSLHRGTNAVSEFNVLSQHGANFPFEPEQLL